MILCVKSTFEHGMIISFSSSTVVSFHFTARETGKMAPWRLGSIRLARLRHAGTDVEGKHLHADEVDTAIQVATRSVVPDLGYKVGGPAAAPFSQHAGNHQRRYRTRAAAPPAAAAHTKWYTYLVNTS